MKAIDKVLQIAEGELGYLEKKSNSQLDDKTANAGSANYTKYWRDIKPEFQGEPWCAVFVTWCFVQAFGKAMATKLLKHYPYVYCPTMKSLFTLNANPKRGDIVVFYRNGEFVHTGIVTLVDGDYFETIEGNTSGGSSIIANGGGVCRKRYYNSNLPGTKFVTVDWDLVEETEEIDMEELKALKETVEEQAKHIAELEKKVGGKDDEYDYIDENMPEWYRGDVQWAKDREIIVGDENGKLGLSPIKLWTLAVIVRTAKYIAKLMGVKM